MSDDRSFGEWPLKRLMTEVVGSGPRTASDMTYDQAYEAGERMLVGDPDPVTLGGFWTANRWKHNTPVELSAYVDAMREVSVETATPEVDPVDCGANYDGKREKALLGVAAGVVSAGAGTPVVAHSADTVPTKHGATYRHVLDELGVETDLAPDESAQMVDETGFGFYYQPRFNPRVHDLLDQRDQLGVRPFVNTVETLVNPANADVHLGSFFHLSFAEKVANTMRESRTAGVERVVMFQGQEGYDDVRLGTIRVAEWDGTDAAGDADGTSDVGDSDEDDESDEDESVVEDYEIDTTKFGLEREDVVDAVDGLEDDLPAASARVTREVVAGDRDDAVADAVALNAGIRIYARGDEPTIEAAVESARDAIADGSAEDVLAAIEDFETA